MEQTAQGPLKAPAVPVHWTEGDIIVPGKWTATATTAAVADSGAEGITTIVANYLQAERFTYPGPLVRAIPTFAMDLPAGWQVSEYPGSLFAMRCAEPVDGGWGNVIVQHQRVLAETTLESAAQDEPSLWALVGYMRLHGGDQRIDRVGIRDMIVPTEELAEAFRCGSPRREAAVESPQRRFLCGIDRDERATVLPRHRRPPEPPPRRQQPVEALQPGNQPG